MSGGVLGLASLPGIRVPARHPVVGLAGRRRADRARRELDRDRRAGAHLRVDVARHRRVDVAGDEDDVLDLLRGQVGQQLLALARIALPRVEALVLAVVDPVGHHQRLPGDDLPGRVRARQLPLEPVELAPAEDRPAPVPARAREGDRVAARLVLAVLALVEHHQLHRAPVRLRAVDPAAAAVEHRHRLEVGLVGGVAAGAREARAQRQAAVRRRRSRSCSGPRGRPRWRSSGRSGGRAAGSRRCGRARTWRGTRAASPPRAGPSGDTGSRARSGRRGPRARRRPAGRSRRRCSRRARRRSRRPRGRAPRRRCSSRACSPRRRRSRSARSRGSPAAARSGSARPGSCGCASRTGTSSARAAAGR